MVVLRRLDKNVKKRHFFATGQAFKKKHHTFCEKILLYVCVLSTVKVISLIFLDGKNLKLTTQLLSSTINYKEFFGNFILFLFKSTNNKVEGFNIIDVVDP